MEKQFWHALSSQWRTSTWLRLAIFKTDYRLIRHLFSVIVVLVDSSPSISERSFQNLEGEKNHVFSSQLPQIFSWPQEEQTEIEEAKHTCNEPVQTDRLLCYEFEKSANIDRVLS